MFEVHDEAVIMGLRAQLSAAVSALDLGSCLPSAAERLVIEGDQIERLGRAIKTLAATKVAETGTWQRDGARSAEDRRPPSPQRTRPSSNRLTGRQGPQRLEGTEPQ